MFEMLQLAVLGVLVLPMAVSDVRERTVSLEMLLATVAASACFFAYGLASGGTITTEDMLAVAISAIMLVMGRMGIMGMADGAVALSISLSAGVLYGAPLAIYAILAGYAIAACYGVGRCLALNAADAVRGRPYCKNMVITHIKKRGERFTVREYGRVGRVQNNVVTSRDGSDYFVDKNASGMPVMSTLPMVSMLYVGLAVSLAAVLLELA